ncbi:surface lipoprotein assembly modifier [Thioclava sp. 'Guangxiensis']|uniref:surface lipoprotein assembly modifier n=1 Tax=Thioclava sp. 'Guangxiensis' TaxID=3149044 RepID=UPI0038781BA9
MRSCASFHYLCAALGAACLLAILLAAGPLRAEQTRSVADWMGVATRLDAEGKPLSALRIYGDIAAQRPDYTPATHALDRVLAQIGSARRSEAILKYVLQGERTHRAPYLAALRRLDATHPFRFSFSGGLLPSSNVSRTSSQTYLITDFGTFLIANGGEEESGIGAEASLEGDWVLQPALGHRLHLRPSLSGEWYSQRQLRFLQPSLALSYENLTGRDDWGLTASARYRAYDGRADENTSGHRAYGISAYKRWMLEAVPLERAMVTGAALAEYRDYFDKDGYDGRFYQLSSTFQHRAGRASLSYGARISRSDVRLDYHRYDGAGLTLGVSRPLGQSIAGGASLRYDWRFYDADFPLMGEPRKDQVAGISVFATLRDIRIGDSSPRIRCGYTTSASNIALYDYESFDCGLSLDLTF